MMAVVSGKHFAVYRPCRDASAMLCGGGTFSLPGKLGSFANPANGLALAVPTSSVRSALAHLPAHLPSITGETDIQHEKVLPLLLL